MFLLFFLSLFLLIGAVTMLTRSDCISNITDGVVNCGVGSQSCWAVAHDATW